MGEARSERRGSDSAVSNRSNRTTSSLHAVASSRTSRRRHTPPLGEILIERNTLTADQLRDAMEQHRRLRKRLGQTIVDLGYASPEAVLDGLSAQLGVPPTQVNAYTVTPEAIACVPERIARKYTAVPLIKVGTSLLVATANPWDLQALDDLRFAAGCPIQPMIALESDVLAAIERCYGRGFAPKDDLDDHAVVVVDSPGPQLDLHDELAQRSATALVDRIIARAVSDRASDVHLEPTRHHLRVRFRIDGTFHDAATLLPALAPSVVARLKVLSGADIAVSRTPQDGRFSATINARGLDVRMSTYPTIWGEKVVLRLLDRTALQLSIDRLMDGRTRDLFRALTHRPEGLILVTGPTGSGKTSTLYAAVSELAEMGRNVTTIEDPVEYWLPGVNQGQTNVKAGFTFARGLRAILRQDPDVIMVGEIRDRETLDTAVEASLTGHVVLSTLHTNGSIATLTRLLEMGVESYVLASAVTGALAQRLVRRVCEVCAEPRPVSARNRHYFGQSVPATVLHSLGCETCSGIGYRGRIGVYELAVVDSELRRLLSKAATEDELLASARARGMRTLREQAIDLVREGKTTVEEILRVFHDLEGDSDPEAASTRRSPS
jgi:type IV pilus assembly protein PilB